MPRFTRQIPGDYFDIGIPDNVAMHGTALVESSLTFDLFRSEVPDALVMAEGSGLYNGAVLDVGPRGRVVLGRCALLTSPLIVCDELVEIGDHALVSWSVVIMDTHRLPTSPEGRREVLRRIPSLSPRRLPHDACATRPVRIGTDVWIGFDCVVLPGVTVGEGAIVGCRSVVDGDVEPYTVVAGNPARLIRRIDRGDQIARLSAVAIASGGAS
jgi:acetyltransferase-like isoleucine patch superfamily enzyme